MFSRFEALAYILHSCWLLPLMTPSQAAYVREQFDHLLSRALKIHAIALGDD